MPDLLIPRHVAQERLEDLRDKAFNPDLPEARKFTKKLTKAFEDRRLQAGWVGCANIPGLVNFCWHIRRFNEQVPPTYLPMVDGEGKPRELGNAIIRQLQEWDMQSRAAQKPDPHMKEKALLAVEKKDSDAQEERLELLNENIRAYKRAGAWGSPNPRQATKNRTRGRRGANIR